MSKKTYPVTVRLPLADVDKLDLLAERTGRTRANVLRLLVTMAQDTTLQDICLAGTPGEVGDHAA